MANLIECKACGKEIAKGVKKCPHCGKDQRNWFMRHKILSFIGVIVLLIAVGSASGGGDEEIASTTTDEVVGTEAEAVEEVKEPMVVSVDELVSALDENALKAENTYNDQYVELTGRLSNIDSSGNYFSLAPLGDEFTFMSARADIEEEHLDAVMEFTIDQEVTVVGTITDVGEIMGYSIDVESIK